MDKYKTFWRRLFAGLIDGFVFLPISMLILYFQNTESAFSFIVWSLIDTFLYAAYYIVFHVYSGQTIGKWIFKIKVLSLDEKNTISYFSALKRESLWMLTNIILLVYFTVFVQYSSGNGSLYDDYQHATEAGIIFWLACEMVTMLLNSKRRAIHDFIAGSVVVKV